VEPPPDPAPHAEPGSRPNAPGMTKKTEKASWDTRWAAVGALATAAATVVAFLAYAHPSGGSPGPSPSSATSQASPPYTVQPPEHGSTAAATSPGSLSFSPAPASGQPSGPPAGCQSGEAVITTYNKTVGSTWLSEADAAQRAGNGIDAVLSSGASINSTVYSDLVTVNNDFEYLYNDAMEQASPYYEELAATTDTDIQQLAVDCSS
jgi:hypothetical protein